MRVLHVINQFSGRAGAEVSLRDIVLRTQGEELQHAVAVLRSDANRFDGLDDAGVAFFAPEDTLTGVPARVRHIGSAIRAFRPDLVHTALFDANVAGRLAARLSRVPAVTSLVNTPYAPEALVDRDVHAVKLRAVRIIDALLSRHATTAFHAITHAVADAAVNSLNIAPSLITVVPRGRGRDRLGDPSAERRTRVRAALGLDDGVPVLLNVGRQEAQKGQIYLVEALAVLRRRYPNIVLLLVGREGNQTPALRRRIDELDLHGAVRPLGVRLDIGDLLCAADVFVFPSLYEGLGGAVLEAMAMRIPVVATNAPALCEVLDNGRCGLLVPVGDSAALAAGVHSVLEDREGAQTRVEAAFERFATTYELSACLDGMRSFYQSLGVGGQGRSRQPSHRASG